MRAVDHRAQLDRIDQDGRSISRLQRLAEWLHWSGNLILLIAAVLIVISVVELFDEPTVLGATALIGELLAIQIHLVMHLVAYHLKLEVDDREARLRYELQANGDELRHLAAGLGLDLQRYPAP